MLTVITVLTLFSVIPSIPSADESDFTDPVEPLEGSWEILDGHWGDSNISFVHIGTLNITGSRYIFLPDRDAFISQEMTNRFGFIQKTEGNLSFQYREGVELTALYQINAILGTVSFNGGEGFLVRTDIEDKELSITSSISEFEMFRIFKPLIAGKTRDTSEESF